MDLARALSKTETQTQEEEKVTVEVGGMWEERQEQIRGRHELDRGTRRMEDDVNH